MTRLLKFLRLSLKDKFLLTRIALWLWAIRLGLWLLPFRTLCRLLNKWTSRNYIETPDPSSVKNVVRGVRAISRYVPSASCLTQALVTWVFLRDLGQYADLRIGVAKSLEGELEAHAWVESNGKIVIGKKQDHSRYTALSQLKKVGQ